MSASVSVKLVEWKQTCDETPNGDRYQPVTFNSVDPVLVRQNKTVRVLRQSGEALCWGDRYIAPDPVIESPVFLEAPQIKYERVRGVLRWKTSWTYVMAIADDQALSIDDWEKFPAAPVFASDSP